MKFSVLCQGSTGGRLGCLTSFAKSHDLCLETPILLLHTKTGSIPYLTSNVFSKVQDVPGILQMEMCSLHDAAESVEEFGKGLTKFVGLPSMLSYLSLHDTTSFVPSGYNHASGVSMWRKSGRLVLSAQEHVKAVERLQPDIFEVLADTDTDALKKVPDKRAKKAVDRSISYLEQTVELISKSERLKDCPYFVPITGGNNMRNRQRSIIAARDSGCSGYVLSGLCPTGPAAEDADISCLKELVTDTIESLNTPDRVRVFPGPLSPESVIQLVELGVDAFDSSLPYIVTERGCALTFKNRIRHLENGEHKKEVIPPEELPLRSASVPESADLSENGEKRKYYEIDLRDQRYKDDLRPILADCDCYTCRKYTRAYINHLLNVKELLGPILLMMHNLHHYLKFFESIRRCIKDDCLQDLKDVVTSSK